jgi:TRAP-type C4-dicarboxylate transport system permease small subunit
MQQARRIVDSVLELTLVLLMGSMVLNVLWQVFSRFILLSPSSFTEELARYLLIWLGLLGAAYCFGKRSHLAIDVFTARLEGKARLYSDLAIQLLCAIFALVILISGGSRLVATTFEYRQVSPALPVELGHVYLVVPISGLLILFYSVAASGESLQKLAVRDKPSAPGAQKE